MDHLNTAFNDIYSSSTITHHLSTLNPEVGQYSDSLASSTLPNEAFNLSERLLFLASDVDKTKTNNATNPYVLGSEYVGILVLNFLSALFSGLVLGLLSLDITDLEILKKCGTERERGYAASIIPMRKHSNLLLCSFVLANVIVNACLQELLDILFPGLVGLISTTACITIFGEILPQAVCARHGLAIGAQTIWLTWVVIIITFPVSYPLSLILDYALGEEIAFVYDRERLQEYIRITRNYNNLDAQEINIITGALKIKKVPVGHVMTKLKDVFMIDLDTLINYRAILMILKRGFSRIPVFDKQRQNIVGLLMVKDLALINPYLEVTLKSLLSFYKHPIISVDENHTLDVVFNHFREGKSHLALVREHKKKDIVGIVTLEDIIEEVLQVEINDETDIVTNNRELKLRPDAQIPNDLETLHVHLNEAMARRKAKNRILHPDTPQTTTNHHSPLLIMNKYITIPNQPQITTNHPLAITKQLQDNSKDSASGGGTTKQIRNGFKNKHPDNSH